MPSGNRQVADVEVPRARVEEGADCRGAHLLGVAPASNSFVSPSTGTGRSLSALQRLRAGASIEEHAEQSRQRDAAPPGARDEALGPASGL